MKQHLLDTFHFNDIINKKLLAHIRVLQDPAESVKLFSHLINCQHKWLARMQQDPKAVQMSWWEPLYEISDLESEWDNSLFPWLRYIDASTDQALATEVIFTGFDGGLWAATPQDVALQLNYHSIHHRAQIQTIIRNQGLEPDFVDYIGTKYRKLE